MSGIQLFKAKYEVDECLEAIRECLEVGWTGLGFKTIEFEEAWKEYTRLSHAYFTNSSTMGLYMAVEIMKGKYDWSDEDEVITTPITFVSTNHAILRAGLKPIFADVDETLCLSPKSVEEKIGDKTRAIMYVGMGGNVGNYSDIVRLCKEQNLKLILDAAHMAGTRLDGQIPGKEADVVIYSFQAVKNLPTADSGMVCFKSGELDEIVRKFAWLGINKDTYTRTNSFGNYKWKYDVEYLGEKGHGNSIMAAIALKQLKYLDRDNSYRRQLVEWYRRELCRLGDKVKFVKIQEGCESSCHLFQILLDKRDELMVHLNNEGIYPGVHYVSNTEYDMYSYARDTCEYADYVSEHIISLPMNLYITYEDVKKICQIIREFVDKN